MTPDDYPIYYLTDYHDKNDIISVHPGESSYSLNSAYYIRIRPDF
jgi:hypothetical protein